MNNGHTLNPNEKKKIKTSKQTLLWFIQRFIVTHNNFYSYAEYVLANWDRHVRCTRSVLGGLLLLTRKPNRKKRMKILGKYTQSKFSISDWIFTETNLPVGQSNRMRTENDIYAKWYIHFSLIINLRRNFVLQFFICFFFLCFRLSFKNMRKEMLSLYLDDLCVCVCYCLCNEEKKKNIVFKIQKKKCVSAD